MRHIISLLLVSLLSKTSARYVRRASEPDNEVERAPSLLGTPGPYVKDDALTSNLDGGAHVSPAEASGRSFVGRGAAVEARGYPCRPY